MVGQKNRGPKTLLNDSNGTLQTEIPKILGQEFTEN